jgi:hypothetical protein
LSLPRKKRLVLVLLALVALWPLVHRGLVARYGLNPWKFFGFAMYCVPSLAPQFRVEVDYGERVEPLDLTAPHFARARFEVAAFVQQRAVWGRLATPERVAEALFEVLTRVESVEIEVIDPYFDLDTSKVAVERERHRYDGPKAAQ